MEEKDLDKMFRTAFREAEETPSNDIWAKIENDLNNPSTIIPLPKKNNWWIYSAAAVVIVSLGIWGLLLNNKKNLIVDSNLTAISKTSIENKVLVDSSDSKPTLLQKKYDRQVVPLVKETIIAKSNVKISNTSASKPSKDKPKLEPIPDNSLLLSSIEIQKPNTELPQVRQVTEIDDIKPLIEFEEEAESMLASTTNSTEKSNIITTVLNKISKNLEQNNDEKVRFHIDEEGSFGINIINSIAKNNNKKRK